MEWEGGRWGVSNVECKVWSAECKVRIVEDGVGGVCSAKCAV